MLAPRRIPADQHAVEPQQNPSAAGGRLGLEDYVDAFVPAEVVELDLESTGQLWFIAVPVIVGTSVDPDRPDGAPAGCGDGDCRADRQSQGAKSADDGDPYGSRHG
jgi:hypothetical protein